MDSLMTPRTAVAPDPDHVRLAPIDSRGLRIEGGMWADRRAINRSRTIPHGFEHLEASGARFSGVPFAISSWLEPGQTPVGRPIWKARLSAANDAQRSFCSPGVSRTSLSSLVFSAVDNVRYRS